MQMNKRKAGAVYDLPGIVNTTTGQYIKTPNLTLLQPTKALPAWKRQVSWLVTSPPSFPSRVLGTVDIAWQRL